MRKLPLIAAGLGIASLAGIAIAQVTAPQVTTLNADDLIKIVQHGAASVGDKYALPALVTSVRGYYKSIPATGFTYTFGANVNRAIFVPTTTLATGAVTMPASPSDGSEVCMNSKQIITTLTVSANTGQSINDAVTTLAAAGHACYVYSLSNATWDRAE